MDDALDHDEADLRRGAAAAERQRAAALDAQSSAEDLDLAMLRSAEDALAHLTLLTASVLELRERLWAGRLEGDARTDLGRDTYVLAGRVQAFALRVFA